MKLIQKIAKVSIASSSANCFPVGTGRFLPSILCRSQSLLHQRTASQDKQVWDWVKTATESQSLLHQRTASQAFRPRRVDTSSSESQSLLHQRTASQSHSRPHRGLD